MPALALAYLSTTATYLQGISSEENMAEVLFRLLNLSVGTRPISILCPVRCSPAVAWTGEVLQRYFSRCPRPPSPSVSRPSRVC
jgi:hypothetical protein